MQSGPLRYDAGPCFRAGQHQAEIDHLGIGEVECLARLRELVTTPPSGWRKRAGWCSLG